MNVYGILNYINKRHTLKEGRLDKLNPNKITFSYDFRDGNFYKIILEIGGEEYEFKNISEKELTRSVLSWLDDEERDFVEG